MPNVKLLDFTGCGHPDPYRAARLLVYAKNTRVKQGEAAYARINDMGEEDLMKELEFVARSVRSSWEFVSATFQVTDVSRACVDQMTRTRYGVSFAVQAMRVADMVDFQTRVPQTVNDAGKVGLWKLHRDMTASTYKELQEAGIPNQDARGIIPLNALTAIVARYDLRAMADLFGKRINPRAQDEYTEVATMMRDEVYQVMPWTRIFLEPEHTNTPALDALLRKLLGTASPVDKPEINEALKDVDKLRGTWEAH